jgi:Fe(3+) dicitrate transport protein
MLKTSITSLLSFLFIVNLFAQDTPSDSIDVYDKIIMDRITVIGKPAWMDKTPGSATYLDTQFLQKQNYSDVNRILRSVTGINIQEEDGFGLRPNIGLRGTGVERSSKITLMEDGILIAPAPYAAPAAYYFPSIARMSSVEIRKGSSQVKYGPHTTGGALNLISSRIPYELSGKAEVSAGEYSSNKFHASVGNTYKNFGFLIESLQMKNDGFKDLDSGNNTGFDIKDFIGKFMVRTNPSANVYQKLEFKIGYYDEISNETYLGLSDQDFKNDPYRRYSGSQKDEMDSDQTQLSIRHFAQFSDELDLTTTIYRNDFNRNWYKLDKVDGVSISSLLASPENNPNAFAIVKGANSSDDVLSVKANNREYYSRGIQSILGSSFELLGSESKLEFGIRYHEDAMDRFQWVDGYRMQNGTMVITSEGTPGTESNRIESASALAVFIQDKISFDRWILTPGLRYEHIELKRENYGSNDPERVGTNLSTKQNKIDVFVPGMGVSFLATETLNFFGGVHKGFAPPSPGSDAGTKAESSVNYELGTRFNNDRFGAEAVLFFNDYSNLLGSDLAAGGGAGSNEQFNAGEVNVIGAELSVNYELLPNKNKLKLPIGLNYTFTQATFENAFSSNYGAWGDVEKGDLMPYLPEHQINISFGALYKKLALDITGYGTSKMRTIAGQGSIAENESTDSYLLLDLALSYDVTEKANLFTSIKNVTNETYIVSRRPAGVRPGLPQTIMAGVKIDF